MPVRRDTLVVAEYLAALAGTAAMRQAMTRPSAVRERFEDLRHVVEHAGERPYDREIPVLEYGVEEGYTAWAPRYDTPNPAIDVEEPLVRSLIERAPRGTALDAACGTGRHARLLADLGYEVTGVDASEAMLDVARPKVPEATFRLGLLHELPVADASIDLLTCALALTHVDDLGPVFADFARVLRPGGWVVVSDLHPVTVHVGGAAVFPAGSERMELHYVPNLLHDVGEYVTAAVAAGLEIAECHEPPMSEAEVAANPAHALLPDAVRQTYAGLPFLLVWRMVKRA